MPYSYLWSNGSTDQTATYLSAGDYTVTVIDANGCIATDDVTIEQPAAPVAITFSNLQDANCAGFMDGQVTVKAAAR